MRIGFAYDGQVVFHRFMLPYVVAFPSSKTDFMDCKVDVLKGGDEFTNQMQE